MQVPQSILDRVHLRAGSLASTLALAIAERDALAANVASIDDRLTAAYGAERLGLYDAIGPIREELARESAKLEIAKRAVLGLQAIEVAWEANVLAAAQQLETDKTGHARHPAGNA